MDKFCLKWNDFDANIKNYFRKLRKERTLFDVTLATDDGQHVEAHKMILSAGSNFFSDIFGKNNHTNMFIYLKGISSIQLEHILDFIYNGETAITQKDFEMFIETAKELQVKGLERNMDFLGESTQQKITDVTYENKSETDNADKIDSVLTPVDEEFKTITKNNQQMKDDDIDLQIEQIIDKTEGKWKCKVCGKTARDKTNVRQHAETHIEGMSHTCHICGNTFGTRTSLRIHYRRLHTLFREMN